MSVQYFDIEKYKRDLSIKSETIIASASDEQIKTAMTEAWPEVSGRRWGEMTDDSPKERAFFCLTTHLLSGGTIYDLSTTPSGREYSSHKKRLCMGAMAL